VDEAILLADRILLMTNGPQARIAESVSVNLPRPRSRSEVVKNPGYYKIRNYLVDFLVERSGKLTGDVNDSEEAKQTKYVDPTTLDEAFA
jgi:nitrate/nitrite transport system ATP-binding protein